MNREVLVVIFVVAIATSVAVTTLVQSGTRKTDSLSLNVITTSDEPAKIVDATSRLLYHSKQVTIESLKITKHSINLMFDIVIEAL